MPLAIKTDKISVRDGNRFESVDMLMPNAINEPVQEGTSGQVLTTDGQGGRSWQTAQGGGAGQDVQVNGVSVLNDGVANVPLAHGNSAGAIKNGTGIKVSNGSPYISPSSEIGQYRGGTNTIYPLSISVQHNATFFGLAKAAGADMKDISGATVGVYPEAQKSAISEMLNGSVSISGTTPTINALPGVRYVCGEVSTIDIVTPESGIVDVVFTSGSTQTVLTVTPPTGMTMKWANGFDPSALEADTVYEVNVMDGCLGVAGTWS